MLKIESVYSKDNVNFVVYDVDNELITAQSNNELLELISENGVDFRKVDNLEYLEDEDFYRLFVLFPIACKILKTVKHLKFNYLNQDLIDILNNVRIDNKYDLSDATIKELQNKLPLVFCVNIDNVVIKNFMSNLSGDRMILTMQ
jgi:hypothetical protein